MVDDPLEGPLDVMSDLFHVLGQRDRESAVDEVRPVRHERQQQDDGGEHSAPCAEGSDNPGLKERQGGQEREQVPKKHERHRRDDENVGDHESDEKEARAGLGSAESHARPGGDGDQHEARGEEQRRERIELDL